MNWSTRWSSAYRSECSGKDSQRSPLPDAYVAASPPKNEQLGHRLVDHEIDGESGNCQGPSSRHKIEQRNASSHACYGARSGGSRPRNLIMKSRRAPVRCFDPGRYLGPARV